MRDLSPTARRFIDAAVIRQGNAHHIGTWRDWLNGPEQEVTPYVTQIVLYALAFQSLTISIELERQDQGVEQLSYLEMDLGYIRDLEGMFLEASRERVFA